jgi:hypothetical protein
MPLLKLSAEQAVDNRKTNPFATWGDRGQANRVEPLGLPNFAVPFRLERGEPIFTIGSCFARNVETELARRGFGIPARAVFRLPQFANVEHGVINNYGTPSIYNELAWAFGEKPFVDEDHLIEIAKGKFADQHLSPGLRPDSLETVKARRSAITASYRSAAACRVVIMTLGLSEVWYDTRTGFYLNVSPRPSMLRQFPGRYELHVLSYEEAHDYLKRAIELLKANCRPDLQILLTVSPVPLTSTHRTDDVIVANSYSKSVLRTAAEAIVTSYPFVTYYPSFESVLLSDRKFAWMDDLVHVSDAIVRVNVNRMVDAFAGSSEGDDEAIGEGGEPVAILRAKGAIVEGGELAARFFAKHAEWSQRSPGFAAEHCRFLLDTGDSTTALSVLSQFADTTDVAMIAMRCEALLLAGKTAEALETIGRLGAQRVKSASLWDAVFEAALASRDTAIVLAILNTAVSHVPSRKSYYFLRAGRGLRDAGKTDEAIRFFHLAMEEGRTGLAQLELADLLVNTRRPDEARELLREFEPSGSGETTRYRKLAEILGLASAG